MAYTIISQNNTTTTLQDENGNIIYVPGRVTLATSTDYTITEVNNNIATLTDGSGNVIRDVPCVVVLAGGGGSGLPSQTGQSGKFLTTDGTDASWSDKPLVNTATSPNSLAILGSASTSNSVCIGAGASISGSSSFAGNIALGSGATVTSFGAIAIGRHARVTASNAIQIAANITAVSKTNSDANTFKVANANGNYEIMSADGTIPTARLTKVNTTITLAAADWSSNTQTVNVTGMTATGVVMVSPDPTDQSAYTSAGILCTAQAAGTLTFTCDTVPSADIDVNVVCL